MSDSEKEYEELKDELNKKRLRLADDTEAGWFYISKFGKFWVTDIPFTNNEAEAVLQFRGV